MAEGFDFRSIEMTPASRLKAGVFELAYADTDQLDDLEMQSIKHVADLPF